MSAPRAGRSGGPGRGRGTGSRANSPHTGSQPGGRAASPNPRGGSGAGRARPSNGRTNHSVRGRGRGTFGGNQRELKSSMKTPHAPGQGATGHGQEKHVTFAYTGDQEWRLPENALQKDYKAKIQSMWENLKRQRVTERQVAIREGKMADPEKKMKLSEAIKSVGTCEEMCSEWERITRIYDGNVLWPEKVRLASGETVASEEKMVKRFQRSAAGDDEQLPSDLRPPRVLRRTLDYLIDKIMGGSEPMERVQEFFWDRSRAIRNDFSIQQVTNIEDVKIAIECFERITRYHILALHQTAHRDHKPGVEHKQENEQLTNTLTSLLQYYEDNRGRIDCPNEPEFRAYYIIREIGQQKRPDLESRVQQWPTSIVRHPKVRIALKLFIAAGDTSMPVGPLDPKQAITIAQANGLQFWSVVHSPAVPYLMACCAETYFRIIRDTVLTVIWKSCKRPSKTKLDDLLLSDMTDYLGFDNEEQAQDFCESQGFTIAERDDGNAFLDLASISASQNELPGSDRIAIQAYSERLVEDKRHGRLIPAIIKGLSFAQARAQGLLEESEDMEMAADGVSSEQAGPPSQSEMKGAAATTNVTTTSQPAALGNPFVNPFSNPFSKPEQAASTAPTFGLSSPAPPFGAASNPFTPVSQNPSSVNHTPPPLSNQEIASKVFNTGSHSPFALKANAESSVFQTGSGLGQTNGPFSLPATKSPFDPKPNTIPTGTPAFPAQKTSEVQPIFPTTTSSGSIFDDLARGDSKETPASGLGTSLFAKLDGQSKKSEGFQAPISTIKPTAAFTTNDGSSEGSQSPLFVPDYPKDTDKSTASDEKPKPLFSLQGDSKPASIPNDTPASSERSLFGQASNPFAAKGTIQAAQPVTSTFPPASKPPSSQSQISFTPPTSQPKLAFQPQATTTSISAAPVISQTGKPFVPATTQQPNISFTAPSAAGIPKFPAASVGPSQPPSTTFGTIPNASNYIPKEFAATASTPDKAPNAGAFPVANVGNPPSFSNPFDTNTTSKPVTKSPSHSRDELVNKLIRTFALEPNGLIQQFIENEVSETVRSCIRKVNKEREKEQVASARRFLLSCKYVRRWRDIAWRRKLKQNARQRREDFRRSLQEMALSSRASSRAASEIPSGKTDVSIRPESKSKTSMPPPPTTISKTKRVSLPSQAAVKAREQMTFGGSVDKFKDKSVLRPPLRASRMSNTLAAINASKVDKNVRYNSPSNSLVSGSGLMSEQLMKEASRLIDGRTDTTRSDYFKLKAMGLDPNTPIVPQTRKRRNEEQMESAARKSRLSPAKPIASSSAFPAVNGVVHVPVLDLESSSKSTALPAQPKVDDDDDDDLFAQIKAVKSALSETENWYREYREQSERTSAEIAHETEKQKRVREWKPSISRTEARRRRDGLPSFLRSSWRPRDSESTERPDSSGTATQAQQVLRVKREEASDPDSQEEEEDGEGYEEGYEEEEYVYEDRNTHTTQEEYEEREEEYDEEDEEEEEDEEGYDDDHDTQAFGGYRNMSVVNPQSSFAAKGASADDAIEL